MSTTLALARPRVRMGVVKAGGDGSRYSDFDIDLAIRWAGNTFVERTACTRTISTLDILLGNPEVSFSSLTGFVPDLLIEQGAAVLSEDWATAVLDGDTVDTITVNYSAIYDTTPAITFTGGGGTGAAATATLTDSRITAIAVDDGGSGYTTAPTVLINGVANNYSPSQVADGIEIIGIAEIRQKQGCSTSTGTPAALGFKNMTTAVLHPKPAADGALVVTWRPPFTDFVPGTQGAYSASVNYYLGDVVASGGTLYTCIQSGLNQTPASSPTYWTSLGAGSLTAPASVTLNIPDMFIDGVLLFGAGASLVATLAEISNGKGLMALFEQHIQMSAGRGGLGSKSIGRSSLRGE